MNIYEILKVKSQSERHLVRYVKFIASRKPQSGPLEKHHICPKAADLFPEYTDFSEHPWNCIALTHREHYIAHLLLWKLFGGSQSVALWMMTPRNKKNSRVFEQLRLNGVSIEMKSKISNSLKGRPLSEETKKKMALAKLGNKNSRPWSKPKKAKPIKRYRRPASEETKAKMRVSQQARRSIR